MANNFDFSNITLKVIDINLNSSPDIYVNQKNITFTRRVLEDMGYPAYVQYCLDAEQGIFAIRSCKGNEAKAVPFSKPRNEQTTTLTCGIRNVHDIIIKFIPEYIPKKRYKLTGYYDGENKIMYYDLKEAKVNMFHKEDSVE